MSRIASLSRRALGGGESARTFGRDAAARARPCRAHSTENAPPPRLARSHSRLARKIRHDVAPSRRVSAAGPAAGWLARSGRLFCSVCVCERSDWAQCCARQHPPPPQSAPHAPPAPPIARNRARPAATMPRRCVDRRRAWREGSKGRGKIVLASRSRYLQHTLASPPTRNEQPLRNEDDYTKFASDNERAHVNVSCFSFLRCEPHRPRTLAHTARAPDT